MSTTIDNNKLKELIQKTPTKDLLYLSVNPVERDSLTKAIKEANQFIGKSFSELIIFRK